ncbi:MAG: S9 family peptidase, partial [Caldilineae bacterium]
GPRSCDPVALRGERLLFTAHDINHTPDLFLFDLATGQERQITHLNQEMLSQRALPEVVHLTFPGEDGVQVEGWVLVPPTGAAPYPGFLYIHGGPHGAFGNAFHWDFQMLAGAGYGVLIINHRASTGYGDDFATAIHGDWGHLDYTDLMAGLDHAIEQGLLDPDRLAVGGLSGGGNLTCWIVGHTNRFKAAIPENPVTNWVSFYGVSDIGPWFAVRELGGHPHEIPDVYRRCSPITYAHRCTTPTLLVQGEADWRCPAEQSEQFYTVLRANGCPVEMLRLPGSPHGGAIVGRPEVRRAQNEALLEWVGRFVAG